MTPKCISLIMGLNMKETPSVVAAQFLDVVSCSIGKRCRTRP